MEMVIVLFIPLFFIIIYFIKHYYRFNRPKQTIIKPVNIEEKRQRKLRKKNYKKYKENRKHVPRDTHIQWKTSPNDAYKGSDVAKFIPSIGFGKDMYRCGFDGYPDFSMCINALDWCLRSEQNINYIPSRVGYFRDGHRYPYFKVQSPDPFSVEHLAKLKHAWLIKTMK
ncbi:hypothetical protein OAB94_02400 [Flavobacteriaceae bacterium]|nr:hypothetical protein [Flavobacteriaceae bacterium]